MSSLKDIWNDEREKLLAEYVEAGVSERIAERIVDRLADTINDRVADIWAAKADAAYARLKEDAYIHDCPQARAILEGHE